MQQIHITKASKKIRNQAKAFLHKNLLEIIDLRQTSFDDLNGNALRKKVTHLIKECLRKMSSTYSLENDAELIQEIIDEILGLGPLEVLLRDLSITEIMVNGYDQIYVEKRGKITKTDLKFVSTESLRSVIDRIVTPLGRRIDESSPMVDARLPDGSRVNAIIPPLALNGPTLTIRKFSKTPLTIDKLIGFGSLSPQAANFLSQAVLFRQNIIIAGGTGSGKTTLLNALSNFIPANERIVTIEDAAELQLTQEHVVSLEARPANIEGKGKIDIRDLVRNSLRMRPDRIVVGECRSGEALDMLQAMNTGHDGSLTTAHANSPRDTLLRLETMVMMAGFDLPLQAIREQIASALNLIVFQSRMSDGSRKVTHITEICGTESGVIQIQDLFIREHARDDLKPTGISPKFIEKLGKSEREQVLRSLRSLSRRTINAVA